MTTSLPKKGNRCVVENTDERIVTKLTADQNDAVRKFFLADRRCRSCKGPLGLCRYTIAQAFFTYRKSGGSLRLSMLCLKCGDALYAFLNGKKKLRRVTELPPERKRRKSL